MILSPFDHFFAGADIKDHFGICQNISGCQKGVTVFKRFFLQPYNRLYRNSAIRNIIMESGESASSNLIFVQDKA
jgi:hypothetical protein